MASARLARSPPALSNLRLLVTRDREPDAYALAVLRRSGLRLHPQDIIVVTKGLVDLLPPDEMEAALAHEVAHIRNGDNRYAPFFRVFSSLLFFDPLMRGFLGRFTRRSEFRADAEAARQTGKPLVLARALFRLLTSSPGTPAASGLLGVPAPPSSCSGSSASWRWHAPRASRRRGSGRVTAPAGPSHPLPPRDSGRRSPLGGPPGPASRPKRRGHRQRRGTRRSAGRRAGRGARRG